MCEKDIIVIKQSDRTYNLFNASQAGSPLRYILPKLVYHYSSINSVCFILNLG